MVDILPVQFRTDLLVWTSIQNYTSLGVPPYVLVCYDASTWIYIQNLGMYLESKLVHLIQAMWNLVEPLSTEQCHLVLDICKGVSNSRKKISFIELVFICMNI